MSGQLALPRRPAPRCGYGPVVGRVDEYRAELRALTRSKWQTYLAKHSGLPGPRGNIERSGGGRGS
jgi:hypothetical protein